MGIVSENAEKIVKSLRPPTNGDDPTPWRKKVWFTLIGIITVFVVHIALDLGMGMRYGVSNVVRAAELEEKMKGVDARLGSIENKQNTALKLALAQEICRLYHLRNAADAGSVLRQQLTQSFEQKQTDFAVLNNNVRYAVVECSPP